MGRHSTVRRSRAPSHWPRLGSALAEPRIVSVVTMDDLGAFVVLGQELQYSLGRSRITLGDVGDISRHCMRSRGPDALTMLTCTLPGGLPPPGDYMLTIEHFGNQGNSQLDYGLTIGAVGPQGPTVDAGQTGSQGPAGAAGATGPAGPQGPAGETGLAGPQGLVGDTGPAGPQGEQGLAGPQGETGAIGPQGEQGLTGAAGPQGEQGITGATGAIGPQGEQGPTGAVGPQGEQGITGATGAIGPQGEQGPTGAVGPKANKASRREPAPRSAGRPRPGGCNRSAGEQGLQVRLDPG